MGWQEKYLYNQMGSEKYTWVRVSSGLKQFWIRFVHSLSVHENLKDNPKVLPDLKSADQYSFQFCEKMFERSIDSIEHLEGKASQVLSYVVALFAAMAYLYSHFDWTAIRFCLAIPLVFFTLSLVISFRCLFVRTREIVFVDDVYEFDGDLKNKEEGQLSRFCRRYMECANSNETVADNISIMLKTSQHLLQSGLIVAIAVAIVLFTLEPKQLHEKPLSDTVQPAFFNLLERQGRIMEQQSVQLDSINKKIDSLKIQVESQHKPQNTRTSKQKHKWIYP